MATENRSFQDLDRGGYLDRDERNRLVINLDGDDVFNVTASWIKSYERGGAKALKKGLPKVQKDLRRYAREISLGSGVHIGTGDIAWKDLMFLVQDLVQGDDMPADPDKFMQYLEGLKTEDWKKWD